MGHKPLNVHKMNSGRSAVWKEWENRMEKLEFGKRYTWEQVVNAYPGKWARMSECSLGYGHSIVDGILAGVYTDDEAENIQMKLWNENSDDLFRRTTYEMAVGVIDCLNAQVGVRDAFEV